MTHFDEQLKTLQEKIARFHQLSSVLQELQRQRADLAEQVCRLEAIKLDEQADVDRLEGRSLTAFFYNVIGKMDEQLSKERQEAYAARVKYDAAARELEAVNDDIRRCEGEFRELHDCERQYKAVLQAKAAALKEAGGANVEELLGLEERFAFLESQKKELCEAISAGNAAQSTASSVLSSLDSAEGWGTWDMLGGGVLADIAKHSHLDEAQSAIEMLQSQLRRFKTELADISIQADLQVSVDGFLRFADFFFDNLFTDWAVMEQISQSQNQVKNTIHQIECVLDRLNAMSDTVAQEQTQVKETLDKLILGAKL